MGAYYNRNYSNEIESYLEAINKISLLTPEEEKRVAISVRQGNTESREILIAANLRFVVKTARKYLNCGLEFADLISEGNLGLLRAVESFEPDRGFRFISYAVYWIRQSIIKAISEKSKLVRLPLNLNNNLVTIRKKLQNIQNREATDQDMEKIAKEMSMNKMDVIQLIALKEYISLDKESVDDGKFLPNILFLESLERSPEKIAIQNDLHLQIKEILKELPPTEAEILKLRFGINSEKSGPKTLSEIGKMKGLSKERIRQIEEKALKRLENFQEIKKLRAYVA